MKKKDTKVTRILTDRRHYVRVDLEEHWPHGLDWAKMEAPEIKDIMEQTFTKMQNKVTAAIDKLFQTHEQVTILDIEAPDSYDYEGSSQEMMIHYQRLEEDTEASRRLELEKGNRGRQLAELQETAKELGYKLEEV